MTIESHPVGRIFLIANAFMFFPFPAFCSPHAVLYSSICFGLYEEKYVQKSNLDRKNQIFAWNFCG